MTDNTPRLYYIVIARASKTNPEKYFKFEEAEDLSTFSRFTKGTARDLMQFSAKTIAERQSASPDKYSTIDGDSENSTGASQYKFHVCKKESSATNGSLMGVVVSTTAYPNLTALNLLGRVLDEFTTQNSNEKWENAKAGQTFGTVGLLEQLNKYQDPNSADAITKIQTDLDETKIVLHKTIEEVLERGEKIERLVEMSDGLNARSKMFYNTARKQNSCCVVM